MLPTLASISLDEDTCSRLAIGRQFSNELNFMMTLYLKVFPIFAQHQVILLLHGFPPPKSSNCKIPKVWVCLVLLRQEHPQTEVQRRGKKKMLDDIIKTK